MLFRSLKGKTVEKIGMNFMIDEDKKIVLDWWKLVEYQQKRWPCKMRGHLFYNQGLSINRASILFFMGENIRIKYEIALSRVQFLT